MDLRFSRRTATQPVRSSHSPSLAQPYALQGCSSLALVNAVCPSAPQRLPAVILPCKICTRALNARYEHGQPLQPTAPSRPLNRHPWDATRALQHRPSPIVQRVSMHWRVAPAAAHGTVSLGLHFDECNVFNVPYCWCCGECICRYCTWAAQPCFTIADTPSVHVGYLPIGYFGDTQKAGCWLVFCGVLRAFLLWLAANRILLIPSG
ncbi:hypothetical protein GGI43DRAFT_80394 [Trichoderma evansii]